MKPISFRYSHWEYISKYATRRRCLIIKRISPFLLLSLFLTFWTFYSFIDGTETSLATRMVLYPFLSVNVVAADFAMWNYLGGKKVWLIWIIECTAIAMIISWLL